MRRLLAALVLLAAIGWRPALPDALYCEPYNTITLEASGNVALESGMIHELKSIWQP